MINYHKTKDSVLIAELDHKEFIISAPEDVLDLMAEMGERNCSRLIINKRNLNDGFFMII